MATKTVNCLLLIVLNNFFANMCQGRNWDEQKGAVPP